MLQAEQQILVEAAEEDLIFQELEMLEMVVQV
jgi:hypothetical protein